MDADEKYSELLAVCFKDDPGVIAQISGVNNGFNIIRLQLKSEVSAFRRAGYLRTEGDYGLAAAFPSTALQSPEFIGYLQEGAAEIYASASEEELVSLQKNVETAAEITKPDWYVKFTGEKPVCIIQIIAVAKSMRGKGVFRRLITPILDKCDECGVPAVLQTHNPENIPIYEHFGFKIMESSASDKINLTCTGMIRYPDSKN